MTPLERRAAAAQSALDTFKGKPLRYGVRDCVRMTAHHLRRMGYPVRLPRSGAYSSPRSALKALHAAGHADLAAALDSFGFPRIPPAAALVGDILLVPAEGEFGGALHIALGNGKSVSYHQDARGAAVLEPVQFVAAWRVDPK